MTNLPVKIVCLRNPNSATYWFDYDGPNEDCVLVEVVSSGRIKVLSTRFNADSAAHEAEVRTWAKTHMPHKKAIEEFESYCEFDLVGVQV